MTRLRRRSRAVYRVYGEEEYLAGADALLAREHAPSAEAPWPAEEPTYGRRLQRLAGAAALTGAVGTVGGVVGLAGLRSHTVYRREIAQRVGSPVRVASRVHVSAPVHAARRHVSHPASSRRPHARGGRPPRVSPGAGSLTRMAARSIAASVARVGAAQSAPAEAHAGQRAQSEFGFER